MSFKSLRVRLFIFYFLVLISLILLTTSLDNFWVNRSRLAFVDVELQTAGTRLASSGIENSPSQADFEKRVATLLSDERIGKFFVLWNQAGQPLFTSSAASLLPPGIAPFSPTAYTVRSDGRFVRSLSFPLSHGRILQAGYYSATALMADPVLALKDIAEAFLLTAVGLIVAIGFARRLLKPMRDVADEVHHRARLAASAQILEPLQLERLGFKERSGDEFLLLARGLNTLIERVNRGYEVSRAWSFQMAHELKTPLAIMNTSLENAQSAGEVPEAMAESLKKELKSMADTVSAFLLWAEVEGNSAPLDLHVVKLSSQVVPLGERISAHTEVPFQFDLAEAQARVAIAPVYLEIVLNNLMLNAALYSAPGRPVVVRVRGECVEIENEGAPLAAEVQERMGQPFNRATSPQKRGHGLGLATVNSIARISGWKFTLERKNDRNVATVDFGRAEIEG